MESNLAINVEKLSKVYRFYDKPFDRLKETFHPLKRKYHRNFFALQDVSFSVKRGEILGVIGKNGAGKSTLLQIITEVLTPTSGRVEVCGRISALLELGAGFNPELTGLENIFFKSSLLGYSREQTDAKLDEILEFADIGDFVYQPVKTYSSGMFVRLAFAVAITVEPEILIVDEALAVGDFRFKQKCMRKFDSFLKEDKTILFVTHDHGAVMRYCTRALWLMDGKVHEIGLPSDVCKNYLAFMSYGEGEQVNEIVTENNKRKNNKRPETLQPTDMVVEKKKNGLWQSVESCQSFGERYAEITSVAFISKESGGKIDVFEGGQRVVFCVEIKVNKDIELPIVGFHLVNAKGVHLLGLSSSAAGISLGKFFEGESKIIEFEFDFPYMKNDVYSFSPAIAEGTQEEHIQHHWVHDAYVIRIASTNPLAELGNQLVIRENFEIRSGVFE